MSLYITTLKNNLTPASSTGGTSDDLLQTDSRARLVLSEKDGNVNRFRSQGDLKQAIMMVTERDYRPSPWIGDSMPWEITITGQRICFWSPAILSAFGKVKEKPGNATGGYIEYKDITSLALSRGEKESQVVICINSGTKICELMTFFYTTIELAGVFLDTLLSQIKKYRNNDDFNIPANRTIDNYTAASLSELPWIHDNNHIGRTLYFMGSVVYATCAQTNDGVEVVDAVITDIQTYAEQGVIIDNEGIVTVDLEVIEARSHEEKESPVTVEDIVKFCTNCGHDMSKRASLPNFCPKCGAKVAQK